MKKAMAAILSAAMLGTLVSCGNSKNESKDPENNSNNAGKTIGIAMPNQNLDRWNSDGEYLKQKFESAGYKVELTFSSGDATKQNNDIIGMIDNGVDLLLVAAVDGSRLSKTLDAAKEKNIPVIAYDRLIMDTNAVTYYITFDNEIVGKMQGEYVRDALSLDTTDGPYNIEFIAGDANDNNAKVFFKGEYEALEEYIESGKLNILSGKKKFEMVTTLGWSTENAEKHMKNIIKDYYSDGEQLDAVICANDSTALGVIQALESGYKGKAPVIVGQDGDVANLKAIVDGTQAMTVFKNVKDEAGVAYEVCKTLLDGGIPAADFVKTLPVDVKYDSDAYNNNVKYVQSYILAPQLIDEDNLQLLVNAGLYKWDSNNKYLESVN
jgi:putative multiple sugar transport system substrate-binding protein